MKYGLIGEKLGHSFSKEIHKRIGNYPYELKELSQSEWASFLQKREFVGVNVTIPYKESVIPHLDELDDIAQKIGVVNTICNCEGRLIGYNTDYFGLKAMISHIGLSIAGKTVLILGSGGTSKTALAVVEDLGCTQAVRVSRAVKSGCVTYEQAKEQFTYAQVIINTTPCGMFPNLENSAIDIRDFPSVEAVIDVVYNPLLTKLVCDALAHNIPAFGGLYMLVAQAAYASELFTGEPVDPNQINKIFYELLFEKQNIVLIGMPGSGKTTVGAQLAKSLRRPFLDTDAIIEERENCSIQDIITAKGEAYFRDLETAVIHRIAGEQHHVIATGGGAILRDENITHLRENGIILFLDRSLDKLIATKNRPLSSDNDSLQQRYLERYHLYCNLCNLHVSADGSVEDVVKQIREGLQL